MLVVECGLEPGICSKEEAEQEEGGVVGGDDGTATACHWTGAVAGVSYRCQVVFE